MSGFSYFGVIENLTEQVDRLKDDVERLKRQLANTTSNANTEIGKLEARIKALEER